MGEDVLARIYYAAESLATFFPWMRPALWMCHVDTANPDPNGKAYIDQFLDAYNVCVFDTPLSVFKTLPAEKIIAFYNETLNGFWAGEREVRVQPAIEIHFAEQQI